ncbi:MAG: diguanylate cyclase [Desulfuromonadaceae bacterium]|nr:diguanylate cyclase [Desulfuromonadaceae bacterium]MDD5107131.1 diguanylate cyclase [Desulfuromonadaceae bacterium]
MDTLTDLLTTRIRQLETTLDHVGAYVFTKDMAGRYTYANKMACDLFGCPLDLVIGATDEEFFDLSISNELRINDRLVLDHGEKIETEETNITIKGETRVYWSVKLPLQGTDGSIVGMCGISTDITERKKIEAAVHESEEKHRIMFMDSPDAYLIIRDGVFVDCNRSSEVMLRGDRTQIVGRTPGSLSPDFQPDGNESSQAAKEKINEAFRNGSNTFEWVHRRLDGSDFFVEVTIASMLLEGKQTLFTCWRDITERKQAEKALEESKRALEAISITDGLTGIANRRRFDEVLSQEYARHARSGMQLSLILLDIDHFKAFNDNYGHVAGDDCLREVGRVIADCSARPADLAARYGGEEFACILPETDGTGAVIIAEQIRRGIQVLAIPHKGSDSADCVTASLGVVTVQCDANGSTVSIISQADELLYRAKSNGRNRVEFVNHEVTAPEKRPGSFVQMEWKNSFCCGNQLIDSQHQSLFHLSNELLEAILSGRPTDDISVLISRLLDDVGQHFHDEEIILATACFPGMNHHAAEHVKLLAKGVELSRLFSTSALPIGDLFQFLAYDLVMMHMLGADREFFPFIRNAAFDLARP